MYAPIGIKFCNVTFLITNYNIKHKEYLVSFLVMLGMLPFNDNCRLNKPKRLLLSINISLVQTFCKLNGRVRKPVMRTNCETRLGINVNTAHNMCLDCHAKP